MIGPAFVGPEGLPGNRCHTPYDQVLGLAWINNII
jgi:hypothetical protein